MTEDQQDANWNISEWHGKMLIDRQGERIGKLQDAYVDVENDEQQFATVKDGFIDSTATSSPRLTSRRCTTISSSTTHRPTPRADADSPGAEPTWFG